MSHDPLLRRVHELEQGGKFLCDNFVPLVRKVYLSFVETGFNHETALYLTTIWMRTSMKSGDDADSDAEHC